MSFRGPLHSIAAARQPDGLLITINETKEEDCNELSFVPFDSELKLHGSIRLFWLTVVCKYVIGAPYVASVLASSDPCDVVLSPLHRLSTPLNS